MRPHELLTCVRAAVCTTRAQERTQRCTRRQVEQRRTGRYAEWLTFTEKVYDGSVISLRETAVR